jgi:hypothetical protein
MKKLILLVIILAVLGGGAFAGMKFGLIPAGPLAKLVGAPQKKKTAAKVDPKHPPAAANEKPGTTAQHPKETASAAVERHVPTEAPKPVIRTAAKPQPDPDKARRIAKLAGIYENMSPEECVPILEKLPDDLVESMLRKMDESKVSRILVGLKPDRAAKITRALTLAQAP